MTLNEYLAREKTRVFEGVVAGRLPDGFRADEARLADLRERGEATMGTTVLKPDLVVFEFIFSDDSGQSEVLAVEHRPPERIVYLPVPDWVVESIWQGEVQGSHCFESEARLMLSKYELELEPSQNAKWFERQKPKRRD